MNPSAVPERSRETKEKLNDNSSNIFAELSKLVKQSNKNSGSQEVFVVIEIEFCMWFILECCYYSLIHFMFVLI
jgi:hypothetical protein